MNFNDLLATLASRNLPAGIAQGVWDYLLNEDADDLDEAIEMALADWEN